MSKKRKHDAAANTRAAADESADGTTCNLFQNGGGSGSLTSALFGESTVHSTDNGLFSSSRKFKTAVKERISDNANQAAARRQESSVCNTKGATSRTLPTSSTAEDIIEQRRKQAESSFIHEITLEAPFPVNATPNDTHSDDDDEIDIPRDVKVDEIADTVRTNGFAVVTNVVSKSLLDTISSRARDIETQVSQQLDKANISWKCSDQPSTFSFHEVASRCKGRMDVRYGTHQEPFTFAEIVDNASLSPIVHSLLGGGVDGDSPQHAPTLLYAGLIFSLAGSDDQPWHQDGMPLFPEIIDMMLPPYAINVFLPLNNDDSSIEAGPTEFIASSHIMEEAAVLERIDECCAENALDTDRVAEEGSSDTHDVIVASEENDGEEQHPGIISPRLKQGDALLYDYRVCHRGTSNLTQKTRRILYLMYARPWFKEHLNFGSKRLFIENESKL